MHTRDSLSSVETVEPPSERQSGEQSRRTSGDAGSATALTLSHVSSRQHGSADAELDGVAGQFEASEPLEDAEKAIEHIRPVSEPANSSIKQYCKAVIWFLQDQWFLVALAPLIILASQVQVPAAHQQAKETAVTYAGVALIFFITGCTLPTHVLVENYTRWKMHVFVQFQCFLLSSAIVFGIVSACATNPNFMDPFLLIGLIFMGSLPTTIASNVVMTRQAHGNASLTVVESTIGNFLAPFLTPALVSMYTSTGAWYTKGLPSDPGGFGEIYRRIFKQLGLSLFLPMFVGQVVRHFFPKLVDKVFVKWKLSKLGSFSLLAIIWSTYDQAFETGALTSAPKSNMIFIVFISIAIFIVLLIICFVTSIPWIPKKDIISICYCVPAKTPAMGVPITAVMYVGLSRESSSKIQIPMVIYQGLQIMFSSLLTMAHRRWIREEEEEEERRKSLEEAAPQVQEIKQSPLT